MKKLFFLFILFANIILSANAGFINFTIREYYPRCSISFNGGTRVYNNNSRLTAVFVAGNILSSIGQTETKVKCIKGPSKKENAIYQMTDKYETVKYVISPDCKHMVEIRYMGKNWLMSTWYTTSKNEQLTFYEKNKYYQTEGITFDYSDSYSTNSNSSSSQKKSQSSCISCGGTGVSKTPNTGGSRTSWVAYYNSPNNQCPYCGGYTEHFHDRCSSCNVPSY